jgi:hypothetical protein
MTAGETVTPEEMSNSEELNPKSRLVGRGC